jgi:putative flippase GtrA
MGITVHDTQTGLRAFSVNLVDFMKDIPGERYEYEMQVLLQCKQHQVPIVEVPIETIYLDGNASSHFHPIRDSFLIYRELLKFASASFISFLLDYACYCIFLLLFGGMTETFRVSMANILARVISGSFNYQLNRKFVFDNQEKVVKTAGQYVVLAIGILILNTGILNGLTWYLGIQENIAKIITELLLFTVSWSVQKFFIFNHTRSPKRNERA